MKKLTIFAFVSLLITILASSAFGQVNITPVRTDVSGFADWTDVSVAGTTYLQLLVAGASTTSPAMDFTAYTTETLNFKARTFGGVNATENTVTVSISTNNGVDWTDLGTRTPGSTTLTSVTPFDLSSYSGTQVKIRISVAGTSNSIGAGIDDIAITGISATVPTITVSAASLSGFSYFVGSGPSTSQSYNLSGTSLTPAADNLTVTAPANYEVSSDNTTFQNSFTVAYTGGALAATPIYVRLKAGLATGSYNSENVVNSGGGATSVNVANSGTVYKLNPTDHVTSFQSAAGTPAHLAINLTWLDASTGVLPDYYLIKGSSVSYAAITTPVDGVAESDGALVKNIAQGLQAVTITGLNPNTQYFFKIFPYTNSGTNIRYKTDGVVPQVERTTGAEPAGVLLLEENFNFTGNLTDNGWTAHSTGANPVATTTGLSYDGYASSGVGNAAGVDNTGEDVSRALSSAQPDGTTLYWSFLLKVDNVAAGYFAHLLNTSSTFAARIFIQSDADGYNLGLNNSGTGSFASTPTKLTIGTTYLVIVKYRVSAEGPCSLWVFSTGVPSSEALAGVPEVVTTGSGQASISAVALRQYSSSQNITVDGIRVGTAWSESPLPVELSSFTSSVSGQSVNLSWSTATEVDNYGFEVQKSENQSDWSTIGFVHGSGNSNSNKQYAYTDQQAGTGTIYYRLKQIDNAGTLKVYDPIAVEVEIPKDFTLSQNYPNPFNPATTINYTLPTAGSVTLQVYSMNGELVQTLVQGYQAAGSYTVAFDATRLASGTYAYRLITTGADGQTQSALKKMLLMK